MTTKKIRKRKPGGGRKPKGGVMVAFRLNPKTIQMLDYIAEARGLRDRTQALEWSALAVATIISANQTPTGFALPLKSGR